MRSLAKSVFALSLFTPSAVWASQGPGAGPGAADASAQAAAAALALLPLASVMILAALRLVRRRRHDA